MGKEFEIGRPIAYYSYGNGRRCVIVRAVAYLPCCLPDFSEATKP
jgi:hypothetical protein